jgi:hypothetical protein
MVKYQTYPGNFHENKFMFFYSWVLSELFCTVLNASLNPMLYVWRMKEMRLWVSELFFSCTKICRQARKSCDIVAVDGEGTQESRM